MNIFKSYRSKLLSQAKINPDIFWDMDKNSINKLSEEALLEKLLIYGDFNQLKNITKDRKQFSKVYYRIRDKKRCNLQPRTVNFIDLFLKQYA